MWSDVYVEHLEVHDAGETWAEVTEGNPWPIGFVWERLRYDWSEAGAVKRRSSHRTSSSPGARGRYGRHRGTAVAAESRSKRFATSRD